MQFPERIEARPASLLVNLVPDTFFGFKLAFRTYPVTGGSVGFIGSNFGFYTLLPFHGNTVPERVRCHEVPLDPTGFIHPDRSLVKAVFHVLAV